LQSCCSPSRLRPAVGEFHGNGRGTIGRDHALKWTSTASHYTAHGQRSRSRPGFLTGLVSSPQPTAAAAVDASITTVLTTAIMPQLQSIADHLPARFTTTRQAAAPCQAAIDTDGAAAVLGAFSRSSLGRDASCRRHCAVDVGGRCRTLPWSPATTTGVMALVLPRDDHALKWTSTASHRTAHGQRSRSHSGFVSGPAFLSQGEHRCNSRRLLLQLSHRRRHATVLVDRGPAAGTFQDDETGCCSPPDCK
jgi:hypothetical protein